MKNHTTNNQKPVYIHEVNYASDSEISLIDLVMVLIRHRWTIVTITIFAFILGLTVVFSMPKKYTYTTSIEIGSQIINGNIKFFESPQTLLAKLQHGFIPKTLDEHRQAATKDSAKYSIKASIPKNSEIIVIEIKGTEDNAEKIIKLLQSVTTKAIHDHKRIYEAVKKNLISLEEQAKNELDSLGQRKNQEERRKFLKGAIAVHKSELANLSNTREILPPMQSINAAGPSRKLIVIIATLAGIFLGVFSAFLSEFIAKVKERNFSTGN